MSERNDRKIPVIILTGFLGSGKTTILNHIVRQPEMKATAVIINEFGEVGIDHLLVETSEEQLIEINNGCICCTIRGDLSDKLGSLAMWMDAGRVPRVDRVIVETTGLADPAPIMHTLMTEPTLLERFRLDAVVTVVDAIAGAGSLDRFSEAVRQVGIADRLILTKGDLAAGHSDAESQAALRARLARLNPRARLHEADRGRIDMAWLEAGDAEDAHAVFAEFADWLSGAEANDCHNPDCRDPDCRDPRHEHEHGHAAEHAGGHTGGPHRGHAHQRAADPDGITSFVVTLDRPVDAERFNAFLQALVIEHGTRLLRLKGIVAVAGRPDQPAVIHGVQHVLFPVTWLDRWPEADRRTRLVFIAQGLDRQQIQLRFDAALAPAGTAGKSGSTRTAEATGRPSAFAEP